MESLTELEALYAQDPAPKNVTAEAYCVGELFIDPDRWDFLEAAIEDFYVPAHRAILELVREEALDPGGIDEARFVRKLAASGAESPFGGKIDEYLLDVSILCETARGCDPPLYVRKQGRKVRQKAFLRRAQGIVLDTEKALSIAGAEDADADGPIQDALADLGALQGGSRDTVHDLDKVAARALAGLRAGPSDHVVWSGLVDIDRKVGGFRPGEIIVLAGLQGHGKTTVALQVAVNVMDAAHSVLFCSLEMGAVELAERIFCNRAGVASTAVRTRRFAGGELEAIERTVAVGKGHMVIDERGGATMGEIERTARRVLPRHGLDLIVIDHLQLVRSSNSKATDYEKITNACHDAKALAKSMGCPVMMLSQVNREAVKSGEGRPGLRHLKGSGAIEQDADIALMIWRDESKFEDRTLVCDIAKNRGGPLDTVELHVDLEFFRVRNRAPSYHTNGNGKVHIVP